MLRPVLPLTVLPPPRILALASSPQDYPPLDLAKERRNLARALQLTLHRACTPTVVYFMKDALVMALFRAVVGLLGGAVMLRQLQRATTS